MTLIGLGGAARAGKDTIAEILRDDYGFTVLGMSDPLRDALTLLDPWIKLETPLALADGSSISPGTYRFAALLGLVGYERSKTVPEVRRLLQFLGTEIGRKMIDEDVWVKAAAKSIVSNLRAGAANGDEARVVITGIRFPNELEMVHTLAGKSVYVNRPSAIREAPTHASESALSPLQFGSILLNEASLAELHEATHHWMSDLGVSRIS